VQALNKDTRATGIDVKKALQEASLDGKDINSVEWYDFSGYQKKYQY